MCYYQYRFILLLLVATNLVHVLCLTTLSEKTQATHKRRASDSLPILEPLRNPLLGGPIDPYNYTCTYEERQTGRCRWCNREYPSENGVWAPYPPYWQFPGKCSNQAFDVEDTTKCMKGRTVYAIGNSVGRQSAFNMVDMLGGGLVKREDQRDMCPKHISLILTFNQPTWDDSCHSEFADVKIKYLFLQFPDGLRYADRGGFPYFRYKNEKNNQWTTGKIAYNYTNTDGTIETKYYDNPHDLNADGDNPMWLDDNCINHNTKSCLEKFFSGATERDILIFTLGMTFGQDMNDREGIHNPSVDMAAWLLGSGSAFKGHLASTFPGQVFRTTLAEFNSAGYVGPKSPNLKRANDLLWQIWKPSSEEKPWYTIDQWAINQNRHYLYNDHVHFNGPLTHAMLHQVLNELCPGGGKTTWLYPTGYIPTSRNYTELMKTMKKTIVVSVDISKNAKWFLVLMNGVRHNIPDMDTLAGLEVPNQDIFSMSRTDLEMFLEGEPLEPCDPAWTSQLCKHSVYYKSIHNIT